MADPQQPEDGTESAAVSPDDADATSDTSEAGDEQAGRPYPKGTLDPELIKLGRRSRGVGPVLAVSIVLFCGYMMLTLRADLKFSRAGDAPKEYATAAALVQDASAESYVKAKLHPDRSYAVRVRKGESKAGHRVTPVMGTGGKLWLVESGIPWRVQSSYDTVYAGRIRRLSDMPFHGSLRSHLSKHPAAPTYVDTAALKSALSKSSTTVAHVSGDALPVTAETQVHVAETILDKVLVRAFRTERHPNEAAWTKALTDAGLGDSLTPTTKDEDAFVYVVTAPAGIADVKAKLAKAKLFLARAEPVKRTHRAAWSTLSGSEAGLVMGTTTVPWRNISAASIAVPRRVADGAWVLVENESPGSYWYLLPLYVVLALFSALFIWAFARGLRRGTPIPSTSHSASAPA